MIDPQFVEFAPSADHSRVVNGVPVVSRYDLSFYAAGSGQPLEVVNVGKPAPDASGNIHVSFFPSWPAPGQVYEARVTAIGNGGQAVSTVSNQFSFSGQCNYVLSASSLAFASGGGNGSVGVLTLASCTWSGASSASWLSVNGGATTGNGTLSVVAAANTSSASRTATLTIGGQDVNVTQAGASTCAGTVSVANISAASQGASGQFSVSVPSGCSWTASSPVSWISTSPTSGGASATVNYNVQPNTTTSARSATLMVASKPVVVSQAAGTSTGSCGHLSAASASVPASGTSGTFDLNEAAGCSWTASSAASWVTVSPTSGSGWSPMTYVVAPNTTTSARTTTLTVSGNTFSISQAAGSTSCNFTVGASAVSAGATGASAALAVSTQTGCAWNASSGASWVTVTPASGSGSGNASYTVAPNPTTSARSTTLTIAGKSVAVSQSGLICAPVLGLSAISPGAGGASGSIGLTLASGCAWTASTPVSWVTLGSTSGSGSGSVGYTVAPNTLATTRSATLLVAGQPVLVTQAGTACSLSVSATSISATSLAKSGEIGVTANCAWTATSPVSWVTVTPASGSSNGSVRYSIAANTGSSERSTILTIAGKAVSVTQTGQSTTSCTYTVPTGTRVTRVSTGVNVSVTTQAGCTWTAKSNVSWIKISAPTGTASGSGKVSFTASMNWTNKTRSGTITIAGKTYTVTQDS